MCKSCEKFGKCRLKEERTLNRKNEINEVVANGNQYDSSRNKPTENCVTEHGRQNIEL